ncbi:MAG: phosphoribosyltransferase [Vulcanococcus sp.]
MRQLSWAEFDQAVTHIAASCAGQSFCGIHGIPRGGLVLAVALSHRLALPLLPVAQAGCLVVDDVVETGRTLEPHRQLVDARLVVWVSKLEPQGWQAVEVTHASDWIVFPWEDAAAAAADEAQYRLSRA